MYDCPFVLTFLESRQYEIVKCIWVPRLVLGWVFYLFRGISVSFGQCRLQMCILLLPENVATPAKSASLTVSNLRFPTPYILSIGIKNMCDNFPGLSWEWGYGRQAWNNSKGSLFSWSLLSLFSVFISLCIHTHTALHGSVLSPMDLVSPPFYLTCCSVKQRTFMSQIQHKCLFLTTHFLWLHHPLTNLLSTKPLVPNTPITQLLTWPGSRSACRQLTRCPNAWYVPPNTHRYTVCPNSIRGTLWHVEDPDQCPHVHHVELVLEVPLFPPTPVLLPHQWPWNH